MYHATQWDMTYLYKLQAECKRQRTPSFGPVPGKLGAGHVLIIHGTPGFAHVTSQSAGPYHLLKIPIISAQEPGRLLGTFEIEGLRKEADALMPFVVKLASDYCQASVLTDCAVALHTAARDTDPTRSAPRHYVVTAGAHQSIGLENAKGRQISVVSYSRFPPPGVTRPDLDRAV